MSILGDELANDPLGRGYSGLTDQAATDDINTRYRPGLVPPEEVHSHVFEAGNFITYQTRADASIVQAASLSETSGDQEAVVASIGSAARPKMTEFMVATERVRVSLTSQDLSDTGYWGVLTQECVDETIDAVPSMTAAERTAFLALRDNRQTRGEELGIGIITLGNVVDARAA